MILPLDPEELPVVPQAPHEPKVGSDDRSSAEADEGDRAIARLTAARAFLLGEWMGATMMLLSFTQLYVIVLGRLGSGAIAVGVGIVLLALGSWTYLLSRLYYNRVGLPVANRMHAAAAVVAGSAAAFWALFAFLAFLVWRGIEVT